MRLIQKNSAFLFTLLYAFLLACLFPFHELWLDETEPWLLALYSDTYSELLYNKRFEGHPNLWYSVLYVVTRFTQDLQALKISHLFFSVGFVYLFLRYAPFHWLIRLLFCFGYYGVYEYGLISRLYAPELFTTFIICALYPKRFSHWYLYIGALVLNAQTHLFGLYFSGIMGLLLFSEAIGIWKNVPHKETIDLRKLAFGMGLWILGCCCSLWSITHYLGLGGEIIWDPYKFHQASTRIWQAFFPVPDFMVQFWNTSYLRTRQEIPLSLATLAFLAVFLKPRKLFVALVFLFIALFYFFAFRFELSLRHHAHFFLFTVSLFWISTNYQNYSPSLREVKGNRSTFLLNWLLFLSTAVQFMVGIYAVYMEYRYSFYPAKEASAFLQKHYPAHLLATTEEFPSSTITAYSKRPIYNLARGRYSTFYEFDPVSENNISLFQNLDWAQVWAQKNQQPVILISSQKIALEFYPYQIKYIGSFDRDQIVALPRYRSIYMYLVQPNPLPSLYFVGGNIAE